MKRLILSVLLFATVNSLFAQTREEEEEPAKKKFFKKENLFTGGSVNVNFFNGQTVLGASPVMGYSINRFIDAGIALNFTYTGIREYTGDKYRQFVYGPGVFARLYPVKMIFAQGVYEHNFISLKYLPAGGGPSQQLKLNENSMLVGGGYCNGREGVGSLFYYVSILFDVTKKPNSPYVEQLQDGSYRALPIIKAGLQIPLFNGGGGGYDPDER